MAISILRDENQLITLHPPSIVFICTENGCHNAFRACKWTSMKRSVERHLLEAHDILITSYTNRCRNCNNDIGNRPSRHHCPQPGNATPEAQPNLEWKCNSCEMSFPSKQGLINHKRQHRIAIRIRDMRIPLPQPHTRRRRRILRRAAGSNSTSEEDAPTQASIDNISVSSHNNSTPSTTPNTPHETPPHDTPPNTPPRPNTPTTTPNSSPNTDDSIQHNPTPSSTSSTSTLPRTLQLTPDTPQSPPTTQNTQNSTAPTPPHINNTQDAPHPLQHFTENLQNIYDSPVTDANWLHFIMILDEIITHIHTQCKIPPTNAPRTNNNTNRRPASDHKLIQRLYKINRRRAIREILGEERSVCPADADELQDHFSTIWAPQDYTPGPYTGYRHPNRPPISNDIITEAEVMHRLQRAENTAPGPDKITYSNWRTVDPECTTLTIIFNICRTHRRIPSAWKASRTILIPKPGDPNVLSNWRSIALSSTIYKLYTGTLSARLSKWLITNKVLHPAQKGFLPYDGVLEHNFAIQELIQQARSGERELCICWLDISNAFGSVPHQAIIEACLSAGLGATFTEIITDLISNCTSEVMTATGPTPPILVQAGVKQGCPLSGLLFNLAINPLVELAHPPRFTQNNNTDRNIHALAYADDITLITDTSTAMNELLQATNTFAHSINLTFNPLKCKSLHIARTGRPVRVQNTVFRINDIDIPNLRQDFDSHNFLGVPVGYNPITSNADIKKICDTGLKVLKSKLAPWQRLDAIKTFIYPAMHHHMRVGRFMKKEWDEVDRIFRADIKKTLNLPQEAANEYLYGPRSAGLCGIPNAATTSDQAIIDTAFKLLTSPDDFISTMALKSLDTSIEKRTKNIATDPLRARFLSGDVNAPLNTRTSAPANLWSNTRKATTRQQVSWQFQEDTPSIIIGPTEISKEDRHQVMATARKATQTTHLNRLISLRSQGKTVECISKDNIASHFISDGQYTRFADWRFIHRARLNLVPLNANKHTSNPADQQRGCRRCPYHQETLAHVLNHCMINSAAYQHRHDNILDRVENAAKYKHHILTRHQQLGVPGLRPDLVCVKGNTALIIDVTVAFENRLQALQDARQTKIMKYTPLAAHLASQYANVSIEPIVVGSLGSWHVENDKLLKKICTRSYGKTMKKLIVSDTIRWSRDIYIEHLSGIRQYQPNVNRTTRPNHTLPPAPAVPPGASGPGPAAHQQMTSPASRTHSQHNAHDTSSPETPGSDSHPAPASRTTTPPSPAQQPRTTRPRHQATQG